MAGPDPALPNSRRQLDGQRPALTHCPAHKPHANVYIVLPALCPTIACLAGRFCLLCGDFAGCWRRGGGAPCALRAPAPTCSPTALRPSALLPCCCHLFTLQRMNIFPSDESFQCKAAQAAQACVVAWRRRRRRHELSMLGRQLLYRSLLPTPQTFQCSRAIPPRWRLAAPSCRRHWRRS